MTKALVVQQTKDVQAPVTPRFYEFSQNNSGGRFYKPALFVIVEATSPDEANRRAESLGVYFDGCENDLDCSCCGDRWYAQWENDKGDEVPCIYGQPLDKQDKSSVSMRAEWSKRDKVPFAIISYLDGREETVNVA